MRNRNAPVSPSVAIIGAGKVGRALERGLRAGGYRVRLRSVRRGLPRRISEHVVVLAVRDSEIAPLAGRLAGLHALANGTVVLHVAGALGPEVLAALRNPSERISVGVMHPLASFASERRSPDLRGALLLINGDRAALRAARALGRALGMRPRNWTVDPVLYHAAAVILGNGSAALAAAAQEILVAAGAPRRETAAALGPLLAGVAHNIAELGLPHALTGPVRRGDAATIERHIARLRARAPELVPLYRASAVAQVPLAAALGEADPRALRAIQRLGQTRWKR